MSFLNKLQGWGRKAGAAAHADALSQDMAFEGAYAQPGGDAVAGGPRVASPEAHHASQFDSAPVPHADHVDHVDHSIISEAMPSEMVDFSESRQQDEAGDGVVLPLIGRRPIAEQQRILAGLLGLGLLGLVVLTIVSIVSAGRGSAQVAA